MKKRNAGGQKRASWNVKHEHNENVKRSNASISKSGRDYSAHRLQVMAMHSLALHLRTAARAVETRPEARDVGVAIERIKAHRRMISLLHALKVKRRNSTTRHIPQNQTRRTFRKGMQNFILDRKQPLRSNPCVHLEDPMGLDEVVTGSALEERVQELIPSFSYMPTITPDPQLLDSIVTVDSFQSKGMLKGIHSLHGSALRPELRAS